MENATIRATIGLLANDAKSWLRTIPGGEESFEIVEREEEDVCRYIESLEREVARLKAASV